MKFLLYSAIRYILGMVIPSKNISGLERIFDGMDLKAGLSRCLFSRSE